MSARRIPNDKRRARKLILLATIGALIAAVILYGTCGHGFGLGGGGDTGVGRGTGSAAAIATIPGDAPRGDAPPPRCQLRVDARGVALDGQPITEEAAIAACKQAGAADVMVTGDAVQGTWDHLRAALDQAGIAAYVRGDALAPPDAGV